MMHAFSQQVENAIQALTHCHAMCHAMAMTHCLEVGGEHARPQHLRLMQDCAAICAFTADALGRKSQFHVPFAVVCAQVCETCAESCAGLDGMDDCVKACLACAASCRDLIGPEAEIRVMASQWAPG